MPNEKTILDYIRDKAYKSIEVIFNDARKPEILKLTKAVATQERIVDILSRDNYAQITVTKRNGKIVNIKSEITEKLNKGKNPN